MFDLFLDQVTWYYAIGFIYGSLVPSLILASVLRNLWVIIAELNKAVLSTSSRQKVITTNERFTPFILGLIERFLYMTAMFIGQFDFVGLWLLLKVAGGWKKWADGISDFPEARMAVSGRIVFNVFLIGNGLSIAFAFVGYSVTKLLITGNMWQAVWAGVLFLTFVTFLNVALILTAKRLKS